MKRVVAVVAVLASLSVFAQTQTQTPAPSKKSPKIHEVKFGTQDITGSKKNPLGAVIEGDGRRSFKNLMVIRNNFQAELEKSVDSLR